MLKIILSILSIFMPWLVLLLCDNPGGAIVALAMQATVFGWPFATIWAWKTCHPKKKEHVKQSSSRTVRPNSGR